MAIESTMDMITALRSCDLAPLRLQRIGDSDAIELNESAAQFLDSSENVTLSELSGLGPEIDDAATPKLGARLAEHLSGERPAPSIEIVGCRNAERILCVNTGESVELFEIASVAAEHSRRELRHRLRNHLNTIVMNTELISMLANQAQHDDIARAAVRIETECRECTGSLELL